MKLNLTSILVGALLFFSTACDTQDSIEFFTPEYYVDELATWDFTIGDGLNVLLQSAGIEADDPTAIKIFGLLDKPLSRRLRGVAISYRTIDPFGNDIIASGSFYYPLDNKVQGLIEVPPIAHMDCFHSPTRSVINKDFYEEMAPCLMEYITINPDMIGGQLTGTYIRPYLIADIAGRNAIDMRRAVDEYLRLNTADIRLPKNEMIMGYSLGGSTALAMAKYYQERCPDIDVTEVITGGGVYDAITAFREYAKWGECIYPAIPYMIVALNTYYNLNLDFNKIFTGGLEDPTTGYGYWFDNQHTSMSIAERWGSNLHSYLHADFFKDELSGEFLKLKPALEENSLVYNYTPKYGTRIQLIHSTEDNLIPRECGQLLYDVYKSKGVSISDIPATGDHYKAGTQFLVSTLLYLLVK